VQNLLLDLLYILSLFLSDRLFVAVVQWQVETATNATTISTDKDVALSIVLAEHKHLMTFSMFDDYSCCQSQTSHQENLTFSVYCHNACHHLRNRHHSLDFYNDFYQDGHHYAALFFVYL
jgi:hypothetical protein